MLEAIIIEFEAELEQNHRVVEDEFVVTNEKYLTCYHSLDNVIDEIRYITSGVSNFLH